MSIPVPGTVAARVTVTVMMLLLAIGGRPTTAIGTWPNLAFAVAQTATSHEEEEERHAGKTTGATSGRRTPAPDTFRRATRAQATHDRAAARRRVPTFARIATHRDADLRNGIGTPLRC